MQYIENKLFSVVKGAARGYVLSEADFIDKLLILYNIAPKTSNKS